MVPSLRNGIKFENLVLPLTVCPTLPLMSLSLALCKVGERFLTHRRAGKIKQGSTGPPIPLSARCVCGMPKQCLLGFLPVSPGTTQAEECEG